GAEYAPHVADMTLRTGEGIVASARNGSIPDRVRLTQTLRASPRSPVTSSHSADPSLRRVRNLGLPGRKARASGLRSVSALTRWKLAGALFAALAGSSICSPRGAASAPAPAAASRGAAIPFELRRPLHVSAEAAGISRSDLVARVLHARSLRDVQTLTEKL